MVAIKVTIKPGVAGFIGEVSSGYVLWDNEGDESRGSGQSLQKIKEGCEAGEPMLRRRGKYPKARSPWLQYSTF